MRDNSLIPLFGKGKIKSEKTSYKSSESSDKAFVISRCSTREARRLLDLNIAEKFHVLPLGHIRMLDGDVLTVASVDDGDMELQKALEFASGKEVRLIAVEKDILERAIFFAYRGDEEELSNTFNKARDASEANKATENRADISVLEFRGGNSDAAKCLSLLIDYACSHRASDLHLVPLPDGAYIRIRINGELFSTEENSCSRELLAQMVSRLKVLSALDINNRITPQDGSFAFPLSGQTVHARISTMPTVHGEKAVIRLLGLRGVLSFEELGMDEVALEWIKEGLDLREGLILFCGPTGSGKTTSIYAALDYMKAQNFNVVSIEDPVEVFIPGVTQTSIKEELGLSYATALRSVLRQDPDVIMIGEIRDLESVKVAVNAALSGHIIMSTIHGRNPTDVVLRLRQFGINEIDMFQSVSMIIGQRLIPRLCPACSVFDLMGTNKKGYEVHKEVGCKSCDYSGYSGRVPIVEILRMDKTIRSAISEGRLIENGALVGISSENFLPFSYSLETLLKRGSISLRQFEIPRCASG